MLGARRSIFRRARLLQPMFVTRQLMVQLFPFAKNKIGTVLVRLSWDVVFVFCFLRIFSCSWMESSGADSKGLRSPYLVRVYFECYF